MAAAKTDTATLIDLVIDRAPLLRAAGVTELGIDGLVVKLRSLEAETAPADPVEEKPLDIWSDPDTFGGGAVPGRKKEQSK